MLRMNQREACAGVPFVECHCPLLSIAPQEAEHALRFLTLATGDNLVGRLSLEQTRPDDSSWTCRKRLRPNLLKCSKSNGGHTREHGCVGTCNLRGTPSRLLHLRSEVEAARRGGRIGVLENDAFGLRPVLMAVQKRVGV